MDRKNLSTIIHRFRFILLFAGITFLLIFILFTPWNTANLTSQSNPVLNYDEAIQRINVLKEQEPPAMNPVCRTQFLTHGQATDRVIVFVHGYTNCPQQFYQLSQRFYELGYNILSAPLPYHGLADRMTEEQANLRAEELVAYASEMVDIAQGLGKQTIMLGISGGAVTTAWAAQNRPDLDLAVIISPAFGYQQIPTLLTVPAANIFLTLPNSFVWWDPVKQADIGPEYAYPRYATHPLAEFLRLGFAIQSAAQQSPASAGSILVITNANDQSVNNSLTYELTKEWRRGGAILTTYEFEAQLGLPHDLIDPNQPDQQIDIVYSQIVQLVTNH